MREVIEGAGGVVVVIPHSADPDSWRAAYEIVDAVVMMGGPDVSAEAYGATAHPLTKPGHAGFDTTELGLARACLQDGKPVLGICRGNQVLNVAAGGTLVQDVPSTGTPLVHMGEWVRVVDDPPSCYHEIEVLAGHAAGRLARSRDARRQLLPPPGRGAARRRPAHRAVAPDGTIEAVESANGAFARRPAVAQRVPHARRRALRPSAAGARRRCARVERRAARPPASRTRDYDALGVFLHLQPRAVREHERGDDGEVQAPGPAQAIRHEEEPQDHEQQPGCGRAHQGERHRDRASGRRRPSCSRRRPG